MSGWNLYISSSRNNLAESTVSPTISPSGIVCRTMVLQQGSYLSVGRNCCTPTRSFVKKSMVYTSESVREALPISIRGCWTISYLSWFMFIKMFSLFGEVIELVSNNEAQLTSRPKFVLSLHLISVIDMCHVRQNRPVLFQLNKIILYLFRFSTA